MMFFAGGDRDNDKSRVKHTGIDPSLFSGARTLCHCINIGQIQG